MSYTKVIEFLKQFNAEHIYHGYRLRYFKLHHNSLLTTIIETTNFLINPTFTERLYCFSNNMNSRPICKMCNNSVTYNIAKKEYHTYCSQRCSTYDMKTLIGAENPSQLNSVKEKKKQKSIEIYGVDNVSKSQKIKDLISIKRKDYWENLFNTLIENFNFKDLELTEKEYNRLVHRISNWMYKNNSNEIDPNNLRGKDYHLDHKVSIKYGYINNISPKIIGDITNLELLSSKDNISKNYRNSISINTLLELYNKRYKENEEMLNDEIICKRNSPLQCKQKVKRNYPKPIKINNTTNIKCTTCSNNAEYFYEKSDTYCCMQSRNSCPEMRKKNSSNQKVSEKKRQATLARLLKSKCYTDPTSSTPSSDEK
jgi:hypothetical protein